MSLKIQLYNEQFGQISLGNDVDEVEPKGLAQIKQTVKRSKENDGVIFSITTNLQYAKSGREFIKNVYEAQGIEGVIIATIWQLNPNSRKYEKYYTGKVKLSNYEIDETFAETSTEQTGFEIKVTNRMDNDVDLAATLSQGDVSIPATPFVNIPFHSRKVKSFYRATPNVLEGAETGWNEATVYAIGQETTWKKFTWLSKANGNVGNEPSEDSAYWRLESSPFTTFDALTLNVPAGGSGGRYETGMLYGQISNERVTKDEVSTAYSLPFGWQEIINALAIGDVYGEVSDYVPFLTANPNPRFEFFKAEFTGTVDLLLSVRLKHKIEVSNSGGDVDICGSGALGSAEIFAWFEHRDLNGNVKEIASLGDWPEIQGCGGNERETNFQTRTLSRVGLSVAAGDTLYWYTTTRIFGTYEPPSVFDGVLHHDVTVEADPQYTFVSITNETTYPGSGKPVKALLVHEAMQKISQFITDQIDCFYSEFFGRTDIGYSVDGPGALMVVTSGDNIRLRDRPIFANMTDLFESLNSMWCLGFGVETINGKQKVRVEKKEHFYNKSVTILSLGKVSKLKKKPAMDYYFSQVEMTYPKMDQSDQINGADEVNTVRRFLAPLTQAIKKLPLTSSYRTSGYEIEALRRKENETTDDKVDANNFLVCVVRDDATYKTETNVGFATAGIYAPETAYNLRVTNRQNIVRWIKIYASNILRQVNKIFKFSYGEANYTATINGKAENANIDCTGVKPIWWPELYTFESPLLRDEMKLVLAAPYGVIKFMDEFGNPKEGFVVQIDHEVEAQKGSFTLLKVYR